MTTTPRPGSGCPGLIHKLYWRSGGGEPWSRHHCFEKIGPGHYESLCGKFQRATSGGQACSRPIADRRCPRCDIEEMKIRGKDESLPPSPRKDGRR